MANPRETPDETLVTIEPITSQEIVDHMAYVLSRENWEAFADSFPKERLGLASCTAEGIAATMAEVGEYLYWRGSGYTHEAAREKADRLRKKVRKAQGFSYP